MSKPYTEQCDLCRFFRSVSSLTSDGVCRVRSSTSMDGKFPPRSPVDWCGEFKHAVPASDLPAALNVIAFIAHKGVTECDTQDPDEIDLYSPLKLIRNLAAGRLGIKPESIDLNSPPKLA